MYHNNKGFTLIEVMISALILFSAIAVGTTAFRKTIDIVGKITACAVISDALPHIMEIVREEIMEGRSEGEGHYGGSITYAWESKGIRSTKNIISSYDEVTGGLQYGRFVISLSKVLLSIGYEGKGMKRSDRYEYKELSWLR